MKKRFLCAAASAMILCSACANQAAPEEENEIIADDNAANEGNTEAETAEETPPATPESDTNDPGETEPESDTEEELCGYPAYNESDNSVHAQITFETKEDSDTADDGTILYTSHCIYPVVTIEGNESAAELINADIREKVSPFLADTFTRDAARADYEYYLSDEEFNSEYGFSGYYSDFDTVVTRNDSNVISFRTTVSNYSGGAHGNYSCSGLNYNTKTGETIAFSDLAENAESFHKDTLAYLQELITTETYQDILFESAADDLESVLYQDTSWYLSTSGLTFFSDPYALGPYSSGMIEFTIPYGELTKMGLKDEYAYQGNLTLKLQGGETYTLDINGDGQEDSIQFYIDDIGTIDATVHLIINGTDFAQENTELAETLSGDEYAYYWAECYLYDMDMTDDTVEIALYMNRYYNVENEEDNYGSTFFYRYEPDGTFSYIAMTRGSIADPTTEVPAE